MLAPTRDVNNENDKTKNVLEADNLSEINHDAGEFVWSLPNHLIAYYLANNKGQQQEEVPPDIAIDSRIKLQDKRVRNARNCVTCHERGVQPIDDVITKAIASGATYASKDYQKTLALEEYYFSKLGEAIRRDQEQFAEAVRNCNGLEPESNASGFENVNYRYIEGRVTLEIAARELGCTVEQLRKCGPYAGSGTVNYLLADNDISREMWDAVFYKLASILYQKGIVHGRPHPGQSDAASQRGGQ